MSKFIGYSRATMNEVPPSVSEIVDALGGRRAVGDICGVGYNAVANWCAWNQFPLAAHLALSNACAEKGIMLPDALFPARERKAAV